MKPLPANPLRNDRDEVNGAAMARDDAAEHQRIKKALLESERRFSIMFHTNPVAAGITPLDTQRFTDVNDAFLRLFGYRREEVLGRTSAELGLWPDPSERVKLFEILNSSGEKEQQIEAKYRHKSGEIGVLLITAEIIELNGKRCLFGMLLDITERRRSEEQIRRLNAELEQRVLERTEELDKTIHQLRSEIEERRRAEEKVREISARMTKVREDERSALAKELHDEIGQLLTGLKMMLTIVGRRISPSLPELVHMHETVEELMSRVRELSIDLRPFVLDYLGLLEALDFHLKRYQVRTGIVVHFDKPVFASRLNLASETTLFRIAQEALTNVARHARVAKASLRLWIDDDRVWLQVEDRGQGFNPQALYKTTCGLDGMNERATASGGQFEVVSRPGEGTCVRVSLPLGWSKPPQPGNSDAIDASKHPH